MTESKRSTDKIYLFDVDGTLTLPRKKVTKDMLEFLTDLRKKAYIGIVGGSDLSKQKEQLGENVLELFDYVFSENGLVSYKNGELLSKGSISEKLGEGKLKGFINFLLVELAKIDVPVKRGTFIEYRAGMLNISPVGRNCSQKERDEFEVYDIVQKVRKGLIDRIMEYSNKHELDLKCSIGGQISIDIFPKGWDKTYSLQYLTKDGFTDIHFFGDKTSEGGNDYEIYTHGKPVTGHTVKSPDDTMKIINEMKL